MAGLQKVFIQSCGSRGDLQPYIPIALAIRDLGCEVCITSNTGHQAFVEECGIKFYGCWIDSEKFMQENEECKKALATGSMSAFLKCLAQAGEEHSKASTAKWKQALDDFKPDLVISGSLTELYGRIAAYHLGLPTIELKLQAYSPKPKRAPMGLPQLPCGLNAWVWKNVFLEQFWKGWVASEQGVRESMGVKFTDDIFSKKMFFEEMMTPDKNPLPCLIAQSSIFTEMTYPNLPSIYRCVGHSVIAADEQVRLSKEGRQSHFGSAQDADAVSAFIAAGSQPVYMGWGSMICRSPEYMVVTVSRALKHSGLRGIIQGGWARLNMDMLKSNTKDDALIKYMEENAIFVEKAPHEWLFPQCACAVHHGGAGTFGCASRAGVPSIITPVFLDQFDHAFMVNQLGFGIGFKQQFQKIKPEKLGDAMKKVVRSPGMATKAKEISESMKAEDAPAAVVKFISDFWINRVESGKFKAAIEQRRLKPKA